jgi:hypothetical protein
MATSDLTTGAGSAEVPWRALLGEQRASGMTVKALCTAHGIAASTLFAWRRRLAEPTASSTPAFVEVSPPSVLPAQPSSASIELERRAGGRRVLILRRGFDPALLREALAALGAEAMHAQDEAAR